MIPKAADTEEVFNNLEWEAVEDTAVGSVLEGKTIVGMELVGYPLTEGTLIYYREADGRLWVLESLVSDSCFFEGSDTDDEENPLIFNKARFPAGI